MRSFQLIFNMVSPFINVLKIYLLDLWIVNGYDLCDIFI